VLISILIGEFVFHLPLRGNIFLLLGVSALFLLGALSQGMRISTLAKNQLLASQFAFMSSFLPAFILSGFAFAIANMPHVIQAITYLIPARYFVTILRGIYLKGVGVRVLWPDILLLAIFSAGLIMLNAAKFKKKVT
jgi:ABC-2 type transport system permease protein